MFPPAVAKRSETDLLLEHAPRKRSRPDHDLHRKHSSSQVVIFPPKATPLPLGLGTLDARWLKTTQPRRLSSAASHRCGTTSSESSHIVGSVGAPLSSEFGRGLRPSAPRRRVSLRSAGTALTQRASPRRQRSPLGAAARLSHQAEARTAADERLAASPSSEGLRASASSNAASSPSMSRSSVAALLHSGRRNGHALGHPTVTWATICRRS
jgi:hypothetical protein